MLLQVLRLCIMRRRLLLLNLLHLGKTRRQLLGMIEHLCVRACVCVFVGTSRNLWEPLGSLWQPL